MSFKSLRHTVAEKENGSRFLKARGSDKINHRYGEDI